MSYEKTYYSLFHRCFRPRPRRSREEVAQKLLQQKERARALYIQDRLDELAHYGKDGKVCCCWPDCSVLDPDMLTLDHIADDGAKDRYSGRRGKSLRLLGYPEGLQTLCSNHQAKKEAMRRRGERSPVSAEPSNTL